MNFQSKLLHRTNESQTSFSMFLLPFSSKKRMLPLFHYFHLLALSETPSIIFTIGRYFYQIHSSKCYTSRYSRTNVDSSVGTAIFQIEWERFYYTSSQFYYLKCISHSERGRFSFFLISFCRNLPMQRESPFQPQIMRRLKLFVVIYK